MTSEFHYFELTEIARRIHARKIPPVEGTKTQLDRVEAVDPKLHSYALVIPDSALRRARQAEREIREGATRLFRRGWPSGQHERRVRRRRPRPGSRPCR